MWKPPSRVGFLIVITSFQKDLVVWKHIYQKQLHFSPRQLFQKDLVVWKHSYGDVFSIGENQFQKDLVVWKPDESGDERLRYLAVSEGLSSVETMPVFRSRITSMR